jgi:hypothetical protein
LASDGARYETRLVKISKIRMIVSEELDSPPILEGSEREADPDEFQKHE